MRIGTRVILTIMAVELFSEDSKYILLYKQHIDYFISIVLSRRYTKMFSEM